MSYTDVTFYLGVAVVLIGAVRCHVGVFISGVSIMIAGAILS